MVEEIGKKIECKPKHDGQRKGDSATDQPLLDRSFNNAFRGGKSALSEGLFRLHGEPVGNVGRASKTFEYLIANQATKVARLSSQRGDLDAPIPGLTVRTLNVGFLHALTMLRIAVRFNSAA